MLPPMRRAVLLLVACSASPKTGTATFDDLPQHFADLATVITQHLHHDQPAEAVSLGLHELDGKLPDRSPAALAQTIALLQHDRATLDHVAPSTLTRLEREERDVLLQAVRAGCSRWSTSTPITPTR
jgi:hypothetical protein